MCGASLLQAPAPAQPPAKPPVAVGVVTSAAPAAAPLEEVRASSVARPQAAAEESPVISGPSFLGLNQPAPASRRRNPLSIDPHSGSGNLDYLLEDEEPKSGGALKYILIMIALVAAGGLGYLRWKGQPLPWHGFASKKPSAAAQNPSASNPAAQTPATPDSSAAAPTSSSTQDTPPAAATTSAPAGTPAPNATTPVAPPSATTTPPAADSSGDAKAAQPPAAKDSTAADAPAATDKPAPAQPVASPRRTPRVAADPVKEARKYIYGQSVPQDCDRGLRLLRPAAAGSNPQAMVELGALYSAGLCTPRDLPTAYRWFALALRKDPQNQALNADLQKLWGEMTQPERQLAIRLSQ